MADLHMSQVEARGLLHQKLGDFLMQFLNLGRRLLMVFLSSISTSRFGCIAAKF
jgi:hypothetical protein